jgi:TetR/AcrR family transcriptional repressor of nem operon
MARPKAFDPDLAVEQAMDVFWCRGYEATSVQDLVDATGVGRQSLYGTFGSKDELYLQALDRYRELEGRKAFSCLEGDEPPLERIRALFERFGSERSRTPRTRAASCSTPRSSARRPADGQAGARGDARDRGGPAGVLIEADLPPARTPPSSPAS